MKNCGIDLGTTNSCIVVVADDGYQLVADEHGHQTFPSVVYVGRDGKRHVGYAAKNRIGDFPGPVATIKRKMGSTETVRLGDSEAGPVEVSAMILTYLKQMAEKQMGEEIDRAVVTVPAYFSHIQRQQTDEAGKKAGFREVITLLEPVAAALAYSLSSDREKLRVFVYDLGGGTFDATVLEKDRYGGITVLSFGGDPFLGGDDIDARLARLLMQRLVERGYRLELELDRQEDFSRFQRLKAYAELAKIELSENEEATLTRQGLFEDLNGETVDLDLNITRQELEDCARDLIQRSIDQSVATLSKKQIAPDSVDEVIMVGGMSRMPLAQRMLAEVFGREPKVVDPDLIVARGAAVKASEVFGEQAVAASGLRLELRYDRQTDKERARISGLFDRTLNDHTIYLVNETAELSQAIKGTDRFTFDNVPLAPHSENIFTLSLEDDENNPVIEREIKIVHDAKAGQVLVSPGSVVTKPIAVWAVDGLEELFPENTMLPHMVTRSFETADQSGRIVAPIWEGTHEVTRLEIRDIPSDLKVGTPVIIEVSIEADYHIHASARVPDLKREVSARFRIEPIDTSKITPGYVRDQIAELRGKANDAVAKCPSPEAIEKFKFSFSLVQEQIEVELSEAEPKRAKLHEKLGELSALIESLPLRDESVQLQPTFEEFSETLAGIVSRAIDDNHPKLPEARPQIEALRERARVAWEQKDPIGWRRINDQVAALSNLLRPEMSLEQRALGMAAWLGASQVPEMERASGGRNAREIQSIMAAVTEIFIATQLKMMDPQDAINQLIDLYRNRVEPLRRTLGLESAGEMREVDPATMDGRVRKSPRN